MRNNKKEIYSSLLFKQNTISLLPCQVKMHQLNVQKMLYKNWVWKYFSVKIKRSEFKVSSENICFVTGESAMGIIPSSSELTERKSCIGMLWLKHWSTEIQPNLCSKREKPWQSNPHRMLLKFKVLTEFMYLIIMLQLTDNKHFSVTEN